MDTLDRELYTDVTFFNARHQSLLYCFQMLFPPFTIALIVVYICSSYYSAKTYAEKHTKCSSSWATVTAHAVISLAFTAYVVSLDIAALVFRNAAPDYYTASFNGPLFHYPGLLLLWDGIALTTIAVVMIAVCCCRNLELTCLKDKMESVFLLLFSAGVVPLLCLASHACPLHIYCCNNRPFLCHWNRNLLWNLILFASLIFDWVSDTAVCIYTVKNCVFSDLDSQRNDTET